MFPLSTDEMNLFDIVCIPSSKCNFFEQRMLYSTIESFESVGYILSSGKFIIEVHPQVHLLSTFSQCKTLDFIFRMSWMCFVFGGNLMIFWLTECILSLTRRYVFIHPSFHCDEWFGPEWAVSSFHSWRRCMVPKARHSRYCSTIQQSVCWAEAGGWTSIHIPSPSCIFRTNLSPEYQSSAGPSVTPIPSRNTTNWRCLTSAQFFQ